MSVRPPTGIPNKGNLRRLLNLSQVSRQVDENPRNVYSDLSAKNRARLADGFEKAAMADFLDGTLNAAATAGLVGLGPFTGGLTVIFAPFAGFAATMALNQSWANDDKADLVKQAEVTMVESDRLMFACEAGEDNFSRLLVAAYSEVSSGAEDLTADAVTFRQKMGKKAEKLNVTPEAREYARSLAEALYAGRRVATLGKFASDNKKAEFQATYEKALAQLRPDDRRDVASLVAAAGQKTA